MNSILTIIGIVVVVGCVAAIVIAWQKGKK